MPHLAAAPHAIPPHNEVELSREMLVTVLNYLASLFPAPLTLVVHGGACMLLHPGLYAINVGAPGPGLVLPVSRRKSTRDVDIIARALPPHVWDQLQHCIRCTAAHFGLGADWMNCAADVALPMAIDAHGHTFDPIHTAALRPNNVDLHTIFTSQDRRLTLISVAPFWSVALKLVRYQKWDPEDVGALLRNGTRLNGVQWTPDILEKWLRTECWAMHYEHYDSTRLATLRARIEHAVAMLHSGGEPTREPSWGEVKRELSWGELPPQSAPAPQPHPSSQPPQQLQPQKQQSPPWTDTHPPTMPSSPERLDDWGLAPRTASPPRESSWAGGVDPGAWHRRGWSADVPRPAPPATRPLPSTQIAEWQASPTPAPSAPVWQVSPPAATPTGPPGWQTSPPTWQAPPPAWHASPPAWRGSWHGSPPSLTSGPPSAPTQSPAWLAARASPEAVRFLDASRAARARTGKSASADALPPPRWTAPLQHSASFPLLSAPGLHNPHHPSHSPHLLHPSHPASSSQHSQQAPPHGQHPAQSHALAWHQRRAQTPPPRASPPPWLAPPPAPAPTPAAASRPSPLARRSSWGASPPSQMPMPTGLGAPFGVAAPDWLWGGMSRPIYSQ